MMWNLVRLQLVVQGLGTLLDTYWVLHKKNSPEYQKDRIIADLMVCYLVTVLEKYLDLEWSSDMELYCLSVCLSVCGSGLRDPVAYSLLGGGVPYPEHRLHWSLDSVPSIRFLCFPSVMVWSRPFFFSPPRFIRVPCSTNILPVSSLFSSYLPPLRPFLSSQPTPSSVYSPHRPSPIVRPSESYQPSGFGRPISSPGFLPQRPICRFAPAPDICGWWYVAWVWVRGRVQTCMDSLPRA